MKNKEIKYLALTVVFLAFANFFVWKEVLGLGRGLEVVFFDVGQGDSIFVETPQGHQVLIDGGPSGKVILEKLSKAMPFWDRALDLVVLTHPEYDHLQGLLDVLDRYEVANVLWTGVQRETKVFEKWSSSLVEEKATVVIAKRGQVVKAGPARFFIFYPFESLEGELSEASSNESSIVAKLVFGRNTFLFSGDISKKSESEILQAGEDVACNVLKVPHHGSKTANSQDFLEQTGAEIAVISSGRDNKYGHPHPEVLSSLEKFGITVLRTDQKGDIKIVSDGNNFKLGL